MAARTSFSPHPLLICGSSRAVANLAFIFLCLSRIYRHVAKTGEIKDFIVTEESGIAKGIRRVVAVTGHEAAEARRQGESLTAQLNRIESLGDAEKDAALKAYTVVSPLLASISTPIAFSRR